MAAKYSSDFEMEVELSQKSVDQLRGLLKGKGLPRTGKNKILIQRLGHPNKMFRLQSPSLS